MMPHFYQWLSTVMWMIKMMGVILAMVVVCCVQGESETSIFLKLCGENEMIAHQDPLQPYYQHQQLPLNVMTHDECAVLCADHPLCRFYHVINNTNTDLNSITCELFAFENSVTLCEPVTTNGVAVITYYRVPTQPCPPNYQYMIHLSACYFVRKDRILDHSDAFGTCNQNGAHLAAFEHEEKYAILQGWLGDYMLPCGEKFWAGGQSNATDTSILSSWNWNLTDTLIPMTFMNWAWGEPNNRIATGEPCLMVDQFQWRDYAKLVKQLQYAGCPFCEYTIQN
jgi:hypothetical protein